MNKQRLIVLYDGTWNDPSDQTNVYRLSQLLEDSDGDIKQLAFYDPGVGTSAWSKLRGGLFGAGLGRNLLQGYQWLIEQQQPDDEIWLFGFSRGAYTARSLAGFIRKCGLLNSVDPKVLKQAYKLYRNKRLAPDSEACKAFRSQHSREAKVHFIGVWDTVGALGIPGTFLSEFGRYSWHDTRLSGIVQHAYQAIALDEFRAAYKPALWTNTHGEQKPSQVAIEQRWFIGAHANVGGGYGDDPLADISLAWMAQKAAAAGLHLSQPSVAEDAWETPPTASYRQFMAGFYALFRFIKTLGRGRFYRHFNRGVKGEPAVNIEIDDSVWKRWQALPDYRPPTLTDIDLAEPETK